VHIKDRVSRDPLDEDPATAAQRALALKRVEAADEELLELALEVSPRLDRVTRLQWSEIVQAQVGGALSRSGTTSTTRVCGLRPR
jgi:hypothetical protein